MFESGSAVTSERANTHARVRAHMHIRTHLQSDQIVRDVVVHAESTVRAGVLTSVDRRLSVWRNRCWSFSATTSYERGARGERDETRDAMMETRRARG